MLNFLSRMAFFPFLRLPAEVRTRIYRLVLNDGKPIRVCKQARQPFLPSTTRSGKSLRPKIDDEDRERASGHSVLAITATCRQIYLEAISQYYAGNALSVALHGACPSSWIVLERRTRTSSRRSVFTRKVAMISSFSSIWLD